MKKIGSLLILLLTTFTLFSFIIQRGDLKIPVYKPLKTIIIDPGHGGIDPGARGTFSTEANVNLAVSLKLGDAMQKEFPDLKIIYTRTTDIVPGNKSTIEGGLLYRADLANQSKGDLFIAIHCNSAGKAPGGWYGKKISGYTTKTEKVKVKKKWVTKTVKAPIYENYWIENLPKGTETFVWAVSKNDSKIKSVAKNTENYGELQDSSLNIQLPDPNDPAEKARMLVYAQHYFRKSLNFADLIQSEFVAAGRVDRGVKQRNEKGIWVLQATGMPSVLVEIGFVSNKQEEEYMNSVKGQAEIVNNLLTAFRKYKQKIEEKASDQEKK
ncbi:MAG: N-acetylmuramoyl-L-alanine amidase [Bacteroidetes bacterium]|nr:N-acetylmuramoyl-L-alanine amidase [Bacteroidota bacterium]